MSRICSKCGTELEDGTLFCINCGTKLDDAPAPEQKPSQTFDTVSEAPVQSDPQPSTAAPVNPVKPEPQPFASAPAEPFRSEPQPFVASVAPEPKTNTEAAFGVAPEAPGANYERPPYEQQPYYENPPYQAGPAQYPEGSSKVVSTGGFFWLDFLYFIPGIGLLACIIIAIAARNLNIKHHACARLVAMLVLFVILIILSILTVIAITQAGINYEEILRKLQDLFTFPY